MNIPANRLSESALAPTAMQSDVSLRDRPIFVIGCHKSGTSLLRSLLDGHPDLTVLPSEIHFFQYGGFWTDYPLRRQAPRQFDITQRGEALHRFIQEEGACDDPFGASVMKGRYDAARFAQEMADSSGLSSLDALYYRFVDSILLSAGMPPLDNSRLVEKSVENAEFAPLLYHMFPQARFVHIVRNPYRNFLSIKKTRHHARQRRIHPIIESLYNNYHHLYKNQLVIQNYHVVQFEDLTRAPRETMEDVCGFLGLDFQSSMLTPTLNGELWGGNSSRPGTTYTGVEKHAEDWHSELSDHDIRCINKRLGKAAEYLGYPLMAPRHNKYRQFLEPSKGDNLLNYILDRAYGIML